MSNCLFKGVISMLNQLRSSLFLFILVLFTSFSFAATTFANDNSNAVFKLVPTQNMWTFIKLDTSTGAVWQVHYKVGDNSLAAILPISLDALTPTPAKDTFDIYPTENIYNFLLIDCTDGRVWQVQWSYDIEKRFIRRIYNY